MRVMSFTCICVCVILWKGGECIVFKSLKFLLHYCWKFKKSYVFYVFAYQVVYALIPLVAVIFPKFIIDELMGEQRGSYLFVFTIILIGVNMFGNMLAAFFRGRSLICKGEVFNKFQIMVAEKLADCDFERLESSEFLDTKERAKKFIFALKHTYTNQKMHVVIHMLLERNMLQKPQ